MLEFEPPMLFAPSMVTMASGRHREQRRRPDRPASMSTLRSPTPSARCQSPPAKFTTPDPVPTKSPVAGTFVPPPSRRFPEVTLIVPLVVERHVDVRR